MQRLLLMIAFPLTSVMTQPGLAWAGTDPSFPTDCQPDVAHYGQLPNCTYDSNGHLTSVTYSDPLTGSGGDRSGMPGFLLPLFVLAIVISLAVFFVKQSLARGMARQAGLDPTRAGWVTALSDDGLAATYLATASRPSGSPPPVSSQTRADRLRELDDLRSQGLITDAEHASRREAILAEI